MPLSDSDIALAYLQRHGDYFVGKGAEALANRVRSFLAPQLAHRDPYAVAAEVARLAAKPEPAPAPAPAAPEPQLDEEWRQNQMEGIGDAGPDVAGMSWEQYSAYRQRAGIGRSANGKGLFS